MRILYLCTANICRSASAAQLLRSHLAQREVTGVEIRSAGTHARQGMPGCTVAPALHDVAHTSQVLTADLLGWADLVLPAARDHMPGIAALDPGARRKSFTIRQAGRLAAWMLRYEIVTAAVERRSVADSEWPQQYPADDPRRFVTALPVDPRQRGSWLVEELDAARGMVPVPADPEPAKASRWRRRAPGVPATHGDDVPDPHELGTQWHEPAYQYLQEATDPLADILAEVLGAG